MDEIERWEEGRGKDREEEQQQEEEGRRGMGKLKKRNGMDGNV